MAIDINAPLTVGQNDFSSFTDACRQNSIDVFTALLRVNQLEVVGAEAIAQCLDPKANTSIFVKDNEFNSVQQVAEQFGIPMQTIRNRLRSAFGKGKQLTQSEIDRCFEPVTSGRAIIVQGTTFPSVKAAAEKFGIRPALASYRLNRLQDPTPNEIDLCFTPTTTIHSPIDVEGVTYPTFAAAAKHYGVNPQRTYAIYRKIAFPTPDQIVECLTRKGSNKPITVEGIEYPSILAASQKYGVAYSVIRDRLARISEKNPENIDRCFCQIPRHPGRRKITVHGKEYDSITQAAENYEVSANAATQRLRLLDNPTPEQINEIFSVASLKGSKPITVEGTEYPGIQDAAEHYNISYGTATRRLRQLENETPEAIDMCFTTPAERSREEVTIKGRTYRSFQKACEDLEIHATTLVTRIKNILRDNYSLNYQGPNHALEILTEEEIDQCIAQELGSSPNEITVEGVLYPSISAAARKYGVGITTIKARLLNLEKQTPESIDAIFRKAPQNSYTVEINGTVFTSISNAANHFGIISPTTARERMKLLRGADQLTPENIEICFKTKRDPITTSGVRFADLPLKD